MSWGQRVGLAYLVAVPVFAVWVVNLWTSLKDHAVAHHLPVAKGAVGGMAVALLLLLTGLTERAAHTGRGPTPARELTMALLAVVVTSGLAEWFLLLPGVAAGPADVFFATTVAVIAPLAVVVTRRGFPSGVRRVVLPATVVATAVSTVVMAHSSGPVALGTNQRLVWVGLDVAELVFVAVTGLQLLRRRPTLVPATVLACLFVTDAVINISVAQGHALELACWMGCVEIPAAIASVWVGYTSTATMPHSSEVDRSVEPARGDGRL